MTTTVCPLCARCRPKVLPIGPTPCRVLFLGERPSKDEDRLGEPFIGYTGQEFRYTYLPLANLTINDIHLANAVYCSDENYSNPTAEEAQSCMSVHLGPLLAAVKPVIVVPMGAVACGLFTNVNLNRDHGIPIAGSWGSAWQGVVFPMFHPSAGLHSTGYMIPLMSDFTALGKLLKELPQ
jgi:DNA polymerase